MTCMPALAGTGHHDQSPLGRVGAARRQCGGRLPNYAAVRSQVPYPRQAERLGLSGNVVVEFTVSGTGHCRSRRNQYDPKEVVDNPYGLDALWKGDDFVAKGTLAILVIMSVGSWFVIFTKIYEHAKLAKQGRQAHENFWSAGAVEQAIATLDNRSAYHFIAKAGVEATEHHRGLLGAAAERTTDKSPKSVNHIRAISV